MRKIIALFIIGFSTGACVQVYISRGVPAINGGGEVMLLLAIPAAVFLGYILGLEKNIKNYEEDKNNGS